MLVDEEQARPFECINEGITYKWKGGNVLLSLTESQVGRVNLGTLLHRNPQGHRRQAGMQFPS